MKKYTVQLFGLPVKVIGSAGVEIELPDGAGLADIVAALRREVPALAGRVIHTDKNRLIEHFGFNINGRFYLDNEEVILQDGDHIALLTLATGG